MDKTICDRNKTPDLFQEPLRIVLSVETRLMVNIVKEPSNDNTNVVNALQEQFVVKKDPGKNSSQSPPQINHHCCYGCGGPLEDIFCHQCTYKLCGKGAHYGYIFPPKVLIIPNLGPCNNQTIDELLQTVPSFDLTCYSEDGNSFTYDSKSNLVDDSPNVFNPPPQPPTYSYEFCGNDAYYGHNCSLQVPFTYDPEPFLTNSNPQFSIIHRPIHEKTCAKLLAEEHEASINTQPFQYFVVPQPPQEEISVKFLQEKINQIDSVKNFLRKFNRISFYELPKELAMYINTPSWDCPTVCYNDDDYEDCNISITPKEPDNSLSMGDEHLDTILATKSNEFIKSSVENLVLNPSESEGEHECNVPACEDFTTFSNLLFDTDYDFSSSDDQSFYDDDIPKEIYSNPFFDEEIISMKIDPHHFNVELILFLMSSPIILKSIPPGINETDCDPEEETSLIKRLLYDNSSPRPPKEFISKNSDDAIESFSPSSIPVEDNDSFMEEIDLSFTSDDPMLPGIEEDDYDYERDILIFKELLSNDSFSLPKNKSFHFDITSSPRPPAKPPDGNSGILNVKVMGDISELNVPILRLMLNQPTLVPNQETSLNLLSHLGHEACQPYTKCPMMIYGRNTPILDVLFFHFYPH
nr:hypothetical protein [Tanacetum cinerariifolium]